MSRIITSQPPAAQKLGQSTIPFVLVSSGTMGNNGALSGITALPSAYPDAYVWMPAGAIAAGSAAGWYYAQFSSATAATVFNNTYTSGTPQKPASPTAFSTTGPGAYTQTTGSNIAAYTLSIAGNTIGLNGGIEVKATRTYNSTAGAKTLSFAYDTFTFGSGAVNSGNLIQGPVAGFVNRGATNVQGLLYNGSLGVGGAAAPTSYRGAIDSTVTKNLVANMQLATATDFMVLESALVFFLPGV